MTEKIIWHNLPLEKVLQILNSNAQQGLSEKEVWLRQKKFGKNKLVKEKPLSEFRVFLTQFKSPLIYILIIAGIITLILGVYTDSIVIFGAVFLNSIVSFFQENKACRALQELKKIIKIKAKVIRGGNKKEVNAEELVPGDIIELTPGDKVPADGRLIESQDLRISEAPLTGEWLPAEKITETLPKDTPLADRDNMVYMGCIIEAGSGRAVAVNIGKNTEIGKTAILVKETKEEKTPLQKKLAKFSKIVGIIIGLICAFIFIGGITAGRPTLEMFEISVAVAVAAIPEGLPLAMTVILALGMQRILKRKGLTRKLVAAETLGSTSIIATDKTLTLTEGKMEVSETVTLETKVSAKDNKKWEDIFREEANEEQILAITIAVLSNEAFVENPEDLFPLWRIRGRPTDVALILAAAKVGIKKPEIEKEFFKIKQLPFNSQNKFVATLYQKKNKNILYICGAPEKIIGLSSFIKYKGKSQPLDKKTLLFLNQKLEDLTGNGLRVVAVAYKKVKSQRSKVKALEKEVNDLVFVGFIGLKDPLRKEAKEAFGLCEKAGMKPIIATGDHLLTAKAIAKELGLKVKKENILEGQELDKLSDEEFSKKIKNINLYARVEPRHKLRIVKTWQERGEVIAMTGDGINDAPALKRADIGVALGSGAEVAKDVSDLVLLTDNFSIIVAAVEEGRVIIDNIRKVITYLLSDSFTETILIGGSIIFGWPLPILAVQILWINLIEDGPLSICLAFEPREKDIMSQKPHGHNISLLTKEMKALIFIIGLTTDFLLLGLFYYLLKYSNYEDVHIRSVIFAGLTIDSIFYIFSCKSLRKNLWHINPFSNRFLIGAWLFGVIMLLAAFYLSPLQILFKTVPLNFFDWTLVLGLGALNVFLIEITKRHFITKSKV